YGLVERLAALRLLLHARAGLRRHGPRCARGGDPTAYNAAMSRLSRLATVMVLVLATLPTSCSQTILRRMVPTPIVMQDPRLDFSRIVAPDRRVTEESVFFATTRAPAPPGAPERYTSRAGAVVRLAVPPAHLRHPGSSSHPLLP